MAAAGIRESDDIDLFVSEEAWQQLVDSGWKHIDKPGDDKPLAHGVFDAHTNWDFGAYNPTLKQLLSSATILDGVPLASLDEVKAWKTVVARSKDLEDIRLIDEYLSRH